MTHYNIHLDSNNDLITIRTLQSTVTAMSINKQPKSDC